MTAATSGAEEEYVRAKTSVWWDIENCEVPKGSDAYAIANNVTSALFKLDYRGSVSITAYGDTNLIPHAVQQALSSTGVGLSHVPAGVKDASDKKILVDMLLWAIDNPAPANIMLISGDRDFSNALHQLRMRRYTILLAQPQRASVPLVAAARNVWLWTSLAVGDCPISSGEAARVESNGHCHVSSSKTLNDPVSEQAKFSKAIDSISDVRDTTNHNKRKPQNGRATNEFVATCEICNVVCDSFEKFTAHLSDRRHLFQVSLVASRQAQAGVSSKPVKEAEQPVWCKVCQISCNSKDIYQKHAYGKRHRTNLEIQSGKSGNMSMGQVERPKEVLEQQKKNNKKKASEHGVKSNTDYVCQLCNAVCHTQIVFDSHLNGKKHAANVIKHMQSLNQELIESRKLQEKDNVEKDQPIETILELESHSQNDQENTKCFEKHFSIVNQSEVLIDSRKEEEKGVREKDPARVIVEPKLQSQNAQENTKCFENQKEELREICGTSESYLKELHPRNKEGVETVTKPLPNGEYDSSDKVPGKTRECCDGIVKPVNQSEGVTEHLGEVKKKNDKVAFVASDDSQTSVTTKVQESVWCQVCQISCNSKVVYADHIYGKKHRQNLELQSAKHEDVLSSGPAKVCKDNAEKKKKKKEKVVCQNQTVIGSHLSSEKHVAVVKEQTEDLSELRKTREESNQEKEHTGEASEEQALGKINGLKCQEGSDQEKVHPRETSPEQALEKINALKFQVENCNQEKEYPREAIIEQFLEKINSLGFQGERSEQEKEHPIEVTEEQALGKINDLRLQEGNDQEIEHPREVTEEEPLEKTNGLGFQVAQDNYNEELEERNISDSSRHHVHDFTEPKLESLIHKKPRGCLDVIPDRVELSPAVNVTEKLRNESKDKPEPQSMIPVNESAGRRDRLGAEATKREEVKSQVDNLWTRLWGKKS